MRRVRRAGRPRPGPWCAALATLAVLAGAGRAEAAAPVRVPVVIDTDAGDDIDDAFAIALALADPRLEVIGVTTAWGDTHLRTRLVRRLLAASGRPDIPVAEGPATPNPTPFTQRRWALGVPDAGPAPDAVGYLVELARRRPGEVTLLALAPLTNLAAAEARAPGTLRAFHAVVLMAGSIHAGYASGGAVPSAVPSAEYNVASAPQAFATLLASGARVQLFPLDSTQLKFDEVRRDRLFAYGTPSTDALALLYHQWRLWNGWGQLTPTLFDVVPVAWLAAPALCRLEPLRIEVDARGYTRPVAGTANLEACLAIDEAATQRLILETLAPEPRSDR
ncbi:MAG: nucleoside hydrolase [Proteobacteria bacterium]|nr:nucleoside hydrolase [Pseudomonadota bacterium]